MKITLSGFGGENRAIPPINMPDGVGVLSTNQNPNRGDLRPWKAPLQVATVPAGRGTIYRMGRDSASDTQFWLSWPGVVDVVRGASLDDTTERTFYTGDGPPKWTDNIKALAGAPFPTAFRDLGVPAPATPATLVATGGVSTTIETRFYVSTFVNELGEESAPSPVSLGLACKLDATVTINSLAAAPSGSYGITLRRIYRTQEGSEAAGGFFFLREIAIGLTSTTDDNRTLAEPLLTTEWALPPANLSNLLGLWNGMMAGITGGAVRFCVAYQPYAWPAANEVVPVDCKPVALAKFGQSLLVLTTGRPVLVSGGSPDSMDEQPLEFAEACVARRSTVSFGHGVVWACPDGLAYFGSGGPRILTTGILTRDDWQALKPETIVAGSYEGMYLGFYTVGGVTRGFLIDPLNPSGLYFTDITASAMFFDEFQDQLYVLDGVNIKKWDAGAPLTVTFKSRVYRSPKPVNFGCAQVVGGEFPITVKVFADGVLRHTQVVTDLEPFRLPGGFTAATWQLEVSTLKNMQGLAVAQSISELAAV